MQYKSLALKTVSLLISMSICISLAGCSSSSNDRETAVSKETLNTVNADVSEPKQSIADAALIPETTETETETVAVEQYSNTYTINGVEISISHPVEEFLYDLPGSDMKFIDLDAFMEAYGFEVELNIHPIIVTSDPDYKATPQYRCAYINDDGIELQFSCSEATNLSGGSVYYKGLYVSDVVSFRYPDDFTGDWVAGPYVAEFEDGKNPDGSPALSYEFHAIRYLGLGTTSYDSLKNVYGVNGVEKDGKVKVMYGVALEMLVTVAYTVDCLNEHGSTVYACELLYQACRYHHYDVNYNKHATDSASGYDTIGIF